MGVSLTIKPGTLRKPFGEEQIITPGTRSVAYGILDKMFGKPPWEFSKDDQEDFMLLSIGASLYTQENDNFWMKISNAIEEYGVVTLWAEF